MCIVSTVNIYKIDALLTGRIEIIVRVHRFVPISVLKKQGGLYRYSDYLAFEAYMALTNT